VKLLSSVIKKNLPLRRLGKRIKLHFYQPHWNSIPIIQGPQKKIPGEPELLIATSVGAHLPGTMMESCLAAALKIRGAKIHVLLCDGILPACLECMQDITIQERELSGKGASSYLCSYCYKPAFRMYQQLGVVLHRYSDHLTADELIQASETAEKIDLNKIKEWHMNGLAVGEQALAGALRFYARGFLPDTPQAEIILRKYFRAALLTVYAMQNILASHPIECAIFHHGIYVPQGLIGAVCRHHNVRVVTWNPAYRKKCFIFSHHDTYHHTLMTEPISEWERLPWTSDLEAKTLDYLRSRWQGTRDWIWFHDTPEENLTAISSEIGIDFSKPCIGLLTNVFWDAQLHYPSNAFHDMLEWLTVTIRYFAGRPNLQLLIRVHPAEVRGSIPSRQPLLEEIHRIFPTLPPNIFIVSPQSQVSTYVAMSACNAVIIYGTKTGVELSAIGIPIIVAGEAWIRNKGFTLDVSSPEEYIKVLDRLPLPGRLTENLVNRARRYAFHFFFRRMIPFHFFLEQRGWPPFKIPKDGINDLQPGKSLGLDIVCDGILKGTSFIYPAELE
jgi:hypothetical protein